ncbi:MAG: Plug domain-containing protein, partial [Steroidobacteraceae bacterium]
MRSPLVRSAIKAILGLPVLGFSLATHAAEPADRLDELPTVYISAAAIDEDPTHIAAAVSVIDGKELDERLRATLGDTLNGLPGVHSDTFGGGASRPVIRGQGAPRVKVLSDSASLLDASDISPDHAVTAEPLLIERTEVLRGPATLLYGSGAIGGVVNVLDRKIPEARPDKPLSGSLAIRGASVANEKAGALEVTGQATDNLILHAEG